MDPLDEAQLRAWISGELPVPWFNPVVLGARKNVPTRFDTFICLYPREPKFRTLCHGAAIPDKTLRSMISACQLPDDAEERFLRENARGVASPEVLWKVGRELCLRNGLPLGVYLRGRTVQGNHPKAMLWMQALLSPTRFLREFKQAAS